MPGEKDFTIKSFSPAEDWFAVLDRNGEAHFARIIGWVVLDNGEGRDDEIGAAIRPHDDSEAVTLVGDWFDGLAGFMHRSELASAAEHYGLKPPKRKVPTRPKGRAASA